MSDSAIPPGGGGTSASADAVRGAAEHAARAAVAAKVRIDLARDVPVLAAVAELLAQVWLTPPGQPPLAADLLRAIVHADGAVHVACDGSVLKGASAAIFRSPAVRGVYSMIAAARSSDRGVGFALKQAQRAWALEHGATSIAWTFDPLVSRNARFNLVKLGAVAIEYMVDFYGPLSDGIEGQDATDRLTATWILTGDRAIKAAQGHYAEVSGPDLAAVEVDPHRAPDGGPLAARDRTGWWCRVPVDILAVRRRDPSLAGAWRSAVREIFVAAFSDGLIATGMSRDGWYRLTHGDAR